MKKIEAVHEQSFEKACNLRGIEKLYLEIIEILENEQGKNQAAGESDQECCDRPESSDVSPSV